ncbi:AHH domain-containing protein [Lysinibacillus agricola]|uniref:AHH domain-containing protein n=1 Tax=Lysinibacillus agricola TaxID=2590012 RepID=UPI003C1D7672
MDVNSADNGVHIDSNSIQSGAYHRVIHTDTYIKNVANRLEAVERFLLEQKREKQC